MKAVPSHVPITVQLEGEGKREKGRQRPALGGDSFDNFSEHSFFFFY